MGFTIEVSFNARKHNNVTELKSTIDNLAYDYNCERCYTMHEIDGIDNKIKNHQSVTMITFDYQEVNNFIEFIQSLKRERRNGIQIESVYEDDCVYKILYASGSYLKRLERKSANDFKESNKKRILEYSNSSTITPELLILKEFYKI